MATQFWLNRTQKSPRACTARTEYEVGPDALRFASYTKPILATGTTPNGSLILLIIEQAHTHALGHRANGQSPSTSIPA